ncbi:MAG: helix-turn-helix domain-containing protein [Chloroflexota bacterium]|nr:helix-turn-helix domain-containing protein [Chloroflexota bacterium]
MDAADGKLAALRRHHAQHPHPDAVRDPAFTSGDPFFDPRDLVQVRYEMLRRVREEGRSVTGTAATFGVSRPAFYAAAASFAQAGLPGLVPERPGPRRAHKLSDPVVDVLAASLAAEPGLTSADLARVAQERFGLVVHRRSVERALARRKRGLRQQG